MVGKAGRPETTFGTTIRFDWLGFFFKMLFTFGAAATALFLMDHERVGNRGESYLLLLASLIGMCLMGLCSRSGDVVLGDRDDLNTPLHPGRLHADR